MTFIGGDYLISYDRHTLPEAQLNHGFSTSLSQDLTVLGAISYPGVTAPAPADVLCDYHSKPESRSWAHFVIQRVHITGLHGQ